MSSIRKVLVRPGYQPSLPCTCYVITAKEGTVPQIRHRKSFRDHERAEAWAKPLEDEWAGRGYFAFGWYMLVDPIMPPSDAEVIDAFTVALAGEFGDAVARELDR